MNILFTIDKVVIQCLFKIFYFVEVIENKGTSSTYILRLEIAKFLETLFYFVSVDLCVYFL
jgi:hypothetical protein